MRILIQQPCVDLDTLVCTYSTKRDNRMDESIMLSRHIGLARGTTKNESKAVEQPGEKYPSKCLNCSSVDEL